MLGSLGVSSIEHVFLKKHISVFAQHCKIKGSGLRMLGALPPFSVLLFAVTGTTGE
jgi:hypothetical protein